MQIHNKFKGKANYKDPSWVFNISEIPVIYNYFIDGFN